MVSMVSIFLVLMLAIGANPAYIDSSSSIVSPEIAQQKTGYSQIKFRWVRGKFKYEASYHTPTPSSAPEIRNNWVIERTTPGTPKGHIRVRHILTRKDEWSPRYLWEAAIKAYKNGTATASNLYLLKRRHWTE